MTIAYRESGSGPPVVLLHAFPLSAAMWYGQHNAIGGGCRLITPDLRGFGQSALGDAEPSVELMAEDVADLLDQLGVTTVVLGGLSMGGYVTMAFLRRYPERVRAIILADTKAGPDAHAARANRERIAATMMTDGDTAVLAEDLLPTLLGETSRRARDQVAAWVRSAIRSANPYSIAWAQRAMAARPDSDDTLHSFGKPALLIVGAEDVLTPPAEAEAMAGALAHAELVRIPNAGHLSALEDPAAFNEALGSWLARHV
jgi:pimeloyl-ACP methyl ester carboxylesterase